MKLDGKYFAQIDKNGNKIISQHFVKVGNYSFFTRIDDDKKAISFFGDLHPNFEGNVVKAMASAKIGYKKISEIINENSNKNTDNFLGKILNNFKNKKNPDKIFRKIKKEFTVKVSKIEKISDHLNEITISAPLLARHCQVGQIFRLQNHHALAKRKNNQILAMEGVVITALNVDRKNGLIRGILLDYGGSSGLVKNLEPNEPVIFMGPSGKPTALPRKNEVILLIGGGRGNMPLCAIAEEFKKHNCKIIFLCRI